MTDIKQAIQELREAINRGEGWPTIHLAYDALDKSVLERYGVNNPIDAMRQLDWALTKSATGTFVNVETYLKQLEEAVWVPSVTVIQAARDVISQSGPIIINEGRSNEVEVYTTDEKAIAVLRSALDALDALESAVTGDVEYWDVEPGIIGDDVFTGSYSICKDPDSKDGKDWIWLEDKALADKICRAHNLAIGASPTPDLTARIEAAAEEIEMAIEGYNIEQRQWARARSEVGGNIIADGFIGEALLNELNEWDANNPMPRPKTDIAKKIRRHIKISE